MTPKNPFADPEHPIDYNIRGKDVPEQKGPIVPETPKQNRIITASYKDIEFEPLPFLGQGAPENKLFYFNDSLNRVRSAGFDRHARPQEAFGLIMDCLEEKLVNTSYRNKYTDMISIAGEWFSTAFERQGNILIAYLDPEGLVWNSNTYVKDSSFKFVDKQEFDIAGKLSNTWIPLNEFNDDLLQAVYGRKFKDLPQAMRKGNNKAHMQLPLDNTAWPVGRCYRGYGVCGSHLETWTSRGVRKKK